MNALIGVGAWPYGNSSPYGALWKRFATDSSLGLALRSVSPWERARARGEGWPLERRQDALPVRYEYVAWSGSQGWWKCVELVRS